MNLHVHTEWSLLDGMCRIKQLVQRVTELGQTSVAITDHGVMHGVVQFYQECKNAGIKPIIGMEAYVVPDMLDHLRIKETIEASKTARKKMTGKQKKDDNSVLSVKDAFCRLAEEDEDYFGNSVVTTETDNDGETTTSYRFAISHLLLLAKNNEGYKNLMQIATDSQLIGFYNKPRVDMSVLKRYGKGIIATSACRGGEIPRLILRGRNDLAEKKIREYQEIFDEFYLEIQPSIDPEQRIINQTLIEMSDKLGVPLIATSDAHYVRSEDAGTHDILLAIQTDDKFSFAEKTYFIHSEEEMRAAGMPQAAIDNTQAIADKCDVTLSFGKILLPRIDIPEGYSSGTYIGKLCYDSFYRYMRRKPAIDVELYRKRLEYELDVIINKGLADYLLIVQDFLNWARDHNVMIGPGRGSAVGSIVCYFLGITSLDPIEHKLLFERFLNPDRPSMPDIDSDFEEYIEVPDDLELSEMFKSGRQQVLDYVISKYGAECICQIGTFGTMGTRSVLKDVGRALGIDHNEINAINKFVPSESGKQWTLSDCLYGNPKKDRMPVQQIVDFARTYPRLFEVSMDLEGMPRHPSIHAAGVVICPVPVRNLVPLMRGGKGEVVAQFEMADLENLGLLKMDFLGLRTLGALHKTLDLIEARYGIRIDIDEIDLNDPLTMKLIGSGYTDGVFQIESDGMKKMFKDMNTVNFDNVVAGIALFRPGPMQFIPRYVSCLNGYSEPEYLFPELEPMLHDTFGIIVYQEQAMLIARDVAGFSNSQMDGFRKGIGKKDEKKIAEQISWLIDGYDYEAETDEHVREKNHGVKIPGLVKNGVDRRSAEQLGENLRKFGSYCFNKSHAAVYAKLVVVTGYLKAHYPLEYMTPLISSYIGKDDEKIIQYINEAKRMGIRILPPDVNASEFEFTIEEDSIRYGLGAIKGLSKTAMALCEERMRNGRFTSVEDLLNRFGKKELNKKSVDVLCLSGTLDSLVGNHDRFKTLETLYGARGYTGIEEVANTYCSDSTLDSIQKYYAKVLKDNTIEQMTMLAAEHALLGMYVSAHPLEGKAQPTDWGAYSHGMRFDVVGITRGVKALTTRFGKPMAFLSIETLEGIKDATVFSKEYESNLNKLDVGGIRVFTLEVQLKDGNYYYIVKNIKYFRGQAQDRKVE